jgi:hypothetical protein
MTAQEAALRFGAQLYCPWPGDPTGLTPQMYYKWSGARRSDGAVVVRLSYLSFADLWQCSGEKDHKKFTADSLRAIEGACQRIQVGGISGTPLPTEAELQEAFDRL